MGLQNGHHGSCGVRPADPLLAAAAHEEGQTVICVTHDPAVIRQADKMVALDG